MSKIVSFVILSGLVLAAVAAFNVGGVNAREEIKFVQFSVLARDRANYGVDENPSTIPVVSPGIIEQKVKDTGFKSNLPIIRYTSLPAANPATAHQDNNDTQSAEQQEAHNNHANNGNGTGVNSGNGNANQNQNNNGNNGKEKEKEKEKGANSGGGAGTGNSNANQNANSGNSNANNDKASNPDK